MNIPPLPRELADQCAIHNVTKFHLHWSGGSDNGYLTVEIKADGAVPRELELAIETWAYNVFDYNGAGDGTDYGDDLTYDLVEKTVTHQEWFMERTDGDRDEVPMVIELEATA